MKALGAPTPAWVLGGGGWGPGLHAVGKEAGSSPWGRCLKSAKVWVGKVRSLAAGMHSGRDPAPPWDFPSRHPARVPGLSRNFPCAGIPRAPRLATHRVSERDTWVAGRRGRRRWKIPLRERRDVSASRLGGFRVRPPALNPSYARAGLGRVRAVGPAFLRRANKESGNWDYQVLEGSKLRARTPGS